MGRAGGLLNEWLAGIGLDRKDVWICNVLKCRPPGNRDPQPIEIESCEPYLFRQVELIEPRVVATLGNFATKLLTGSRVGITRVRGTPQVHEIGSRTVFVMPLLHPAAALRTPSLLDTLREDFTKLGELVGGAGARARDGAPDSRRADAGGGRSLDRSARPVRLTGSAGDQRSDSAAQTEALGGRRPVGSSRAMSIRGDVGTGKTTFVRGACRELGVTEPIVSPTFTIGRRYRGRAPVSHVDLFRLDGLDGEDPGLLDDYLGGDMITFVEWPEAAEAALDDLVRDRSGSLIRVTLGHAGGDSRWCAILFM